MLYETHMHTPLCKHARGEPEEYAQVAHSRGLTGIIVTCHNPMPNGYGVHTRMAPNEWDTYLGLVQRAKEASAAFCDVRLGLECDYMPGCEDFLKAQTESAPFDYVIGSVHPQIPEYREAYKTDDTHAYRQLYFQHLADAAETGLFDCISHPDVIKRIEPDGWNFESYLADIKKCLDRIAVTGVCMELNTSGLRKRFQEFYPGMDYLKEMKARGIPIVLGGDAHEPEQVGGFFEEALGQLEAVGYETVHVFLQRKRVEISISEAKSLLKSAD